MIKPLVFAFAVIAISSPSFAQSYNSPGPTSVPTTGTRYLNKADRKVACTGTADQRGMKGLSRQQFRAACRGRPIPKGVPQ